MMPSTPGAKSAAVLAGILAAYAGTGGFGLALPQPAPALHEPVECEEEEDEEDMDEGEDDEHDAVGGVVQHVAAPAPPPGALHPSVGSEAHAFGACRRCCFFPRGRCANGYECKFCHYDHEKRKRRTKKSKPGKTTAADASWVGQASAAVVRAGGVALMQAFSQGQLVPGLGQVMHVVPQPVAHQMILGGRPSSQLVFAAPGMTSTTQLHQQFFLVDPACVMQQQHQLQLQQLQLQHMHQHLQQQALQQACQQQAHLPGLMHFHVQV